MTDFASAAMLRLIHHGLQRQGIDPPGRKPPRGAHVPLADKRALVDGLLETHGPLALLRIGEAVHDVPDEPVLQALAIARDALDLVSRWQRLERFVHSRHRIVIDSAAEGSVRLRHLSLDARVPPSAGEDLLVFGLFVALIEKMGTHDLRARVDGETRWRRRLAQWTNNAMPADVSRWELSWSQMARSMATTAPAVQDWAQAARCALASDPGRNWSLPALACDLHASPRTLQRRLTERASSFSSLLIEARLAHSAKLLIESRQAPAAVGYACGFADQAHFTREFKRHTALTPALYRAQFAPALVASTAAARPA